MPKSKLRSSRSRNVEFTASERLLMLLENSSSARWAGLAIISVPAMLLGGVFWWNVQAQDAVYADRRAGVVASLSPSASPPNRTMPGNSSVATGSVDSASAVPVSGVPAVASLPDAKPATVAALAPALPPQVTPSPSGAAAGAIPTLPSLASAASSTAMGAASAGALPDSSPRSSGPQMQVASIQAPTAPTAPPAKQLPATAPATPLPTILPAEFDRQDGMVLGCNELVIYHPRLMVEIIQALAGKPGFEVYGIVNDVAQRQKIVSLLEEKGLAPDTVKFLVINARGMWVRDYGPKFIRNQAGGLTVVDFSYLDLVGTDGQTRPDDDKVPARMAELFRMDVISVPLSMEGGNLLTNGYGLCLTTNHLATENVHRGYTVEKVGQIIAGTYGQRQWSYIDPLPGDATKHADTYVTFLSPSVVAVGSCDPVLDPMAAETMDRTAAQLAAVTIDGRPLEVVRLPMLMQQDGICRSYTNSVLANGTALVPQYSDADPAMNRKALEIYGKYLPNWKIVGIECLEIAAKGGALHCITCNIPSPSLLPVDTSNP